MTTTALITGTNISRVSCHLHQMGGAAVVMLLGVAQFLAQIILEPMAADIGDFHRCPPVV